MFDKNKIKLIAFDLDGTLTQHKQPISSEAKAVMLKLLEKYSLVMAGAGLPQRIFNQIDRLPIDIVGNYGLQYARYNHDTKDIETVWNKSFPCDRDEIIKKADIIRKKYGFTEFKGDSVEFHPSGCITLAILGTKAELKDKLAFDPDRSKRRKIYKEVCELFSDYNVFVGGSSSFDMAPKPYNKYYALSIYCKEKGIAHSEVLFVGDDYGLGGNDESVYLSDMNFLCIDDYTTFPEIATNKLL